MLEYPEYDLQIQPTGDGLLVKQHGKRYLAQRWRLTNDVCDVIKIALERGLTCMIQDGHPQESKLHPHGDGANYLSFSADASHRWTFVLDMDSGPNSERLKQVKFNKAYKHYLRAAEVQCPPEWRSPRHLNLDIKDLNKAIDASAPHWNRLGPKRGRASERGQHAFFIDEEDLHAHILRHWQDIPVLKNWRLIASKKLLGPINKRQAEMDIIAASQTGIPIIIELKDQAVFNTGGETPDMQLTRYMAHPAFHAEFPGSPQGVLIAQSIDLKLARAVRENALPMIAYEVTKLPDSLAIHELTRSSSFQSDILISQ